MRLIPWRRCCRGAQTYPSVLAGPTCDSIDVISEKLELPKLDMGDLVVGRVMGAYTWASASEFNFFPRATVLALDRGRLLDRRRPRDELEPAPNACAWRGALAGMRRPAHSGRAAPQAARTGAGARRRIALLNLHTGERLDIEYFRDGAYVPEALAAIEVLAARFSHRRAACHRSEADGLPGRCRRAASACDPAFSVISGYRSPQTNERLHERSTGCRTAQSAHGRAAPSTCA